jgi:uncharacterized protein (TIGR02231 family)
MTMGVHSPGLRFAASQSSGNRNFAGSFRCARIAHQGGVSAMRRLSIAFITSCAVALATAAGAAELDVTSNIDSVTVYPDGAAVTRIIHVDLPAGDSVLRARDFPPTLDPASLRVEGEGEARLTIGAIDARPPRAERPPVAPGLETRIESLKDERGALDDKIAAVTAQKKFAQRFADAAPVGLGEKGEARPLAEWRAAFAAVADEIATADAAIRDAKVRQRDIDREVARLEAERTANPPRKMEVRIDLASDAAASATFRVTYTVPGARWAPLYDARLDSGAKDRKPSLELVRRAEIVQASGEDWNDVALAVSTVRTARGGNAPELTPLVVRYEQPQPPAPPPAASPYAPSSRLQQDKTAKGGAAVRGHVSMAGAIAAKENEAELETGGFQAVFRVPGRVSVAANEGAKSFRIATATIAPDLLVRTTPALDPAAYLEADFKQAEEAPLLPGRIALYRDGVFVGRGRMVLTAKDETVRLGFGIDDQIKVARALVRKNEGSTGLISTSKTDEREFKITVRNGHATPIRVTVEDQLPVSEIDDVKVDMLPSTTPPTERDTRDRRGILGWSFVDAPGEMREITLGWSVRWPAGKSVVYGPGQS